SVEIIGVSFRDSKNNWKQTISSKKLDWPQLFNSDLNAHKKLGVTVFPTKILIDTNKRIINVYQGNSKKFYTEINSFLKGD
ncbi:MAG: hypothetical protein OIF50_12720, partial [Flavobacteriaceae bacterium]|nr:hypothetical protein [Flavobacteriaceae bacterium]